LSKAHETRESL